MNSKTVLNPPPFTTPTTPPSLAKAALFWFKLGLVSFGGPAGQISIVHHELVKKQHWISEQRFLHALNYCMLLPGPEALQLVIYCGWLMHRTLGGLIAGLLFIFPALVLILFLSWLYVHFGQTTLLTSIFFGLKPAVTAIVIHATHRIGKRILRSKIHLGIALCALIGMIGLDLPYPFIICTAAIFGYWMNLYDPNFSNQSNQAQLARDSSRQFFNATKSIQYWIDDTSPTPSHARLNYGRISVIIGITLIAWVLPIAFTLLTIPNPQPLIDMGWFFTKAALMTFGGAYAVLPYVYQAAVEHFQWLNGLQMMDGLALGETTPGPLIIIVAFVGYLGAQAHSVIPQHEFLSGLMGTLVASWYTFMPSFSLILIGGPFVESTRSEVKLSGVLTSISCAVVGVMTSLAIFFAAKTLWQGNQFHTIEAINWFGVCVCIAVLFLLGKFKRTIPEIILISATLGLLWHRL